MFQLPQVLVAPNIISKSPHFRVADVRGSPSREEPWLRNSYKSLVMFAFSARPGIFESPRNPDFPKFQDFPRFCISSCCSEIGRFLLVVGDKVVTNKILTRLHGRMDPGGYRRWTRQDTSCQNQQSFLDLRFWLSTNIHKNWDGNAVSDGPWRV